jgi:dihydrofolate reductase
VHYVSDLDAAMRDAKHAADDRGERNVLVHGAGTAQCARTAGLLDELEIQLIPVLFGGGWWLFEHLAIEQSELERVRILEGEGGVTRLRYRVRR